MSDNMLLQEATLSEICEELSNRNLSYVFAAKSYSGSSEDELPVLAIGVRNLDITEMIGILCATKAQLIDEFRVMSLMIEDDDEEQI
jgi:hypothetical protein